MTIKRSRTPPDGNMRMLVQMATDMISTRAAYMDKLGMQYNGNRDIYQALGYPKTLQFSDYAVRYERQDIAARIIDAPVTGSWAKMPQVLETEKKTDTPFEKAWIDLDKRLHLISKLTRLDKLTGIGRYGVLFLGFAGYTSDQLNIPVDPGASQLLYVTPFSEGNAEILEWEDDPGNERYGLPRVYRLTMDISSTRSTSTRQVTVHHSRCLHVAENALENEVYGTPRLMKVYNRLLDLEKIVGGSGEMFWQGAFPGMAFKADPAFDMTQGAALMNEEISKYIHQLQRHMKLQGIDIQQLSGNAVDPNPHVDVQIQMISSATGIPKRILLGSERGELASSQDADNWGDVLSQRQESYCEDIILRPLIDLLIRQKVLPTVPQYEINWPPLYIQNDKEKAEVASKRAEALAKYTSGGLDMLMSFDAYLEHVCEYDRDVVDLIIASGKGIEQEIEEEEQDPEEIEEETLPEEDTEADPNEEL